MHTPDERRAVAVITATGSAAITVHVNGEAHTLSPPLDVALLLAQLGYEASSVAVAVNGDFVPRAGRAARLLHDGDHVTCFKPIVGG